MPLHHVVRLEVVILIAKVKVFLINYLFKTNLKVLLNFKNNNIFIQKTH
jgi:hypothetical protein